MGNSRFSDFSHHQYGGSSIAIIAISDDIGRSIHLPTLWKHVTHPKSSSFPKVKTDPMQSGERCFAFQLVARPHKQQKCWRLYIKKKYNSGFLPLDHSTLKVHDAWHSTKKLQSVGSSLESCWLQLCHPWRWKHLQPDQLCCYFGYCHWQPGRPH